MATGTARNRPVCRQPVWRIALLAACVAVLLDGCAHWPDWLTGHKEPEKTSDTAVAPPPAPPPATHKAKTKQAARRPEAPIEVASLDPATLVGLKPVAVTRILGTPGAIRKDEMSLVWTYTTQDCVLQVYFYPDLNTTDFHVLKYNLAGNDGKPLNVTESCLRDILSAKTDDPR